MSYKRECVTRVAASGPAGPARSAAVPDPDGDRDRCGPRGDEAAQAVGQALGKAAAGTKGKAKRGCGVGHVETPRLWGRRTRGRARWREEGVAGAAPGRREGFPFQQG